MTGVSYLKRAEQRLKTCEEPTFLRQSYGQRFLGYSRRLVQRYEPSTQLIIQSFLKSEQSQPFVQNDEVDQLQASFSSTTSGSTHPRCDNRNIKGNALGGIATPCL